MLPDVICSACNCCRDLDLCRDADIQVPPRPPQPLPWLPKPCLQYERYLCVIQQPSDLST